MTKPNNPIITEQVFALPRKDVWDAITKHDLMIQWYFENIPDFEATVGFETRFLIENEGRKFTHVWKVSEVINEERIKYSFEFEEYEGESFVVFELFDTDKGTMLKVSAFGIENFPRDIPEFSRESCQAGWHYFIKERLTKFLINK